MKALKFIGISILALGLTHCAPSSKQLKEAIEKDPSIVFVAIEKDPAQFIEVVNKAAQNAQQMVQQKAAEEETSRREAEFKNPLKPDLSGDRVFMGPADAKVTIVEYSDFECPFCSRGYRTVEDVMKAYPNDVRVLYKHLPLGFHKMAMPSSQYYEALALQDHKKAVDFYHFVFENQGRLAEGESFLKEAAKKTGANMKKLADDIKSEAVEKTIAADMAEAQKFDFSGTPGFLINGVSLRGAYPFEEFKKIIDRHLSESK